ncbi:MAG: hypothetical protein P1U46_01605 [Patescibacteria group bacterium]|nr:hypothetical protein [Patescibacteria group bacterium]
MNFSDTNKEKLYLKIQKILPKYENKNDEKSKNIYYIFKYMESSILLDLFNNMDTSNNIISLDSPFSQARDSKRLSDVNNLLKKINIEMVK